MQKSVDRHLDDFVAKDAGLRAARAFAAQHDPDPDHSLQVCKTALALFDQTAELHQLGDKERRLLAAAGLVHDVGWSVEPLRHHKGSRDLILQSNLDGFTKEELLIVACLARYHRKAHPDSTHSVYRDLDKKARTVVNRLAALLRIADGLDRAHSSSVREVRVEQKRTKVRIWVDQRKPNSTDILGAESKCGLFEQVFKTTVEIAPTTEPPASE